MLYICLDKITNEPKGTVIIENPEVKKEWDKTHMLVEAEEEFAGKQPYEMKYENGKARLATQAEIDIYTAAKNQETVAQQKERALNVLGLTQKDVDSIKEISTKP